MTERRLNAITAVTLALAVLAGGCGMLGATRIGTIQDNPSHYHGRDVTVSGEVVGGLNLVAIKAYTVRDRTGEIVVVTKGAVPSEGASVRVRGRVNQAFAVAGRSLVVLIEDED